MSPTGVVLGHDCKTIVGPTSKQGSAWPPAFEPHRSGIGSSA